MSAPTRPKQQAPKPATKRPAVQREVGREPPGISPESAFSRVTSGRGSLGAADVLALQGTGGNQAVMRLLQARRIGGEAESAAQVHQAAKVGIGGQSGALPHLQTIQKAFGHHDVTGVVAHTGAQAMAGAQAMGAVAFTMGNHVAFAGRADLHTAAHEAAHVIQQRQGVQLAGGVGAVGDKYEGHADAVAEAVVQGKSVEGLLDGPVGAGTGSLSQPRIQRYTESADHHFHISENHEFAVSTGPYPGSLYSSNGAPMALAGGLVWNAGNHVIIDQVNYTRYDADISAYEVDGIVGTAQGCGQFARGITGDNDAEGGDDRSTGDAGTVLKYGDASPGLDEGWENHFAAVVKRDGGDHATFETAVGIPHTWVGIYGINRGQTFKFKTQAANIDRLETIPPAVFPGLGPRRQSWWQWLLCIQGEQTDLVVPRGITAEQAQTYRDEMTAWRLHGTEPESAYMRQVVAQLEAELTETGGQ